MNKNLFSVITTFNKESFESYSCKMLLSFDKHWPKQISIHAYYEDMDRPLDNFSSRVVFHNFNEQVKDWYKFKEKFFFKELNKSDNSVNSFYKYSATKFAHKVYSIKESLNNNLSDYLIWLDSDIFFPTQTLPMLIHATKQITDDRYILTPEIVRWWDASWDCIVNKKYINHPHEMRMSFDIYSLESSVDEDVLLKSITQLKFGAGWFTLLSQKVLNEIKIPIEGGSYGVDDTYFMICGQMIGIKQYVLSGITVAEMSTKFLENKDYIKPLLSVTISDKSRISPEQFESLIKKFYNENYLLHTKQK